MTKDLIDREDLVLAMIYLQGIGQGRKSWVGRERWDAWKLLGRLQAQIGADVDLDSLPGEEGERDG